MPDYLAISVGDGCTIAGVWKGLKDLYAIGFIDKLPRLISAQAEGCHPINRAIAENKPWEPMEENTLADSIAVGVPRNADKALMAIRESNGIVVNVTDEEIMAAQKLLGITCGVFGEPAGVTGTAGVKKLCEQGVLGANDTVVSVVTGNGLKDVANAIKFCGEPMSLPNDLDLLVEEFAKRGSRQNEREKIAPREFWNRRSQHYDEQSEAAYADAYRKTAECIRPYLTPNDRVLDFACGTGLVTLPVAQMAAEVCAIDISDEMVRHLKEKIAEQGVGNVSVSCMDL